jgi:hypothetical protein
MSLEVYYPQDIRNVLQAAEQSCRAALLAAGGGRNEFAQGYGEGYLAALTTIALAFGLMRLDSLNESVEWPPNFLLTVAGGLNPSILPRPPPSSKLANRNQA